MRNIKVRVWDGKKIWGPIDFKEHLIQPGGCFPEPIILMQFTGLQDTNGRDIYEGDVVKVIDDTFYNGEFTGQINQNEYGTWLIKGIGTCKLYDAIKELTVIGNIYETAETEKS